MGRLAGFRYRDINPPLHHHPQPSRRPARRHAACHPQAGRHRAGRVPAEVRPFTRTTPPRDEQRRRQQRRSGGHGHSVSYAAAADSDRGPPRALRITRHYACDRSGCFPRTLSSLALRGRPRLPRAGAHDARPERRFVLPQHWHNQRPCRALREVIDRASLAACAELRG